MNVVYYILQYCHTVCQTTECLLLSYSQDPPFVKLKDDSHLLFGNARYEGYCIDILENIASLLNFRYEIYLLQDAELSGGELRVRTLDEKQDLVVEELKMGVSYCKIFFTDLYIFL